MSGRGPKAPYIETKVISAGDASTASTVVSGRSGNVRGETTSRPSSSRALSEALAPLRSACGAATTTSRPASTATRLSTEMP